MINDMITGSDSPAHVYYAIERLPLIKMLDRPPGRVLEVGCGAGLSLRYLKEHGATYAAGVELRSDVADAARSSGGIDNIYNVNFLEDELPDSELPFNTVIFSHVLEHFANPAAALEKTKKYLAKDARLLIAVPNIRHMSVIMPLLLRGKFEYTESGILDHTHLRFFTKSSAIDLLESSGFRVLNNQLEMNGPRSRLLHKATFGLGEQFAGYAINMLAELKVDK